MAEFRKNQRVVGINVPIEYRIETGPWPSATGSPFYLVEHLTGEGAGGYSTRLASVLKLATPRKGDEGTVDGPVPLYTIQHIDDEVAVLWCKDEISNSGKAWRTMERPSFDRQWRSKQ